MAVSASGARRSIARRRPRPPRAHRARGRRAARDRRAPAPSRRCRAWIRPTRPSTGYDDVRTIAAARADVRDRFRSIQVDWPLYGPKLAQVAIAYGADDIDGVRRGRYARARATGARRAKTSSGRFARPCATPVERDGRYERARRDSSRPARRGRLSERPAARVRPRRAAGSRHACDSTSRPCARACSRPATIDLGMVPSITLSRSARRSHRAGRLHRIGRSGRVGRAVHARGRFASIRSHRARHVVADVGRADAHSVRAPLRDRARRSCRTRRISPAMLGDADAALLIGDPALFADHRALGAAEDRSRRGVDRDDRAAVRVGVLGRPTRCGRRERRRDSAPKRPMRGMAHTRRDRRRVLRRRPGSDRRSRSAICAIT